MPQLVNAIDVSNAQPLDLSALIAEHEVTHVIVRLFLPDEAPSADISREQVKSARGAGCSVGGYVWCYSWDDPRQTVQAGIAVAQSCDLELPVLWLDCETYVVGGVVKDSGPDATWLRAAIDECRSHGVQPGIYTAGWWWKGYVGNTTEFADIPLWVAQYDGIINPAAVDLYGGWTQAHGKQWSGTGLDRDVFVDLLSMPGYNHAAAPTIDQVAANNPNLPQQLASWQTARVLGGMDPHDYPAFRQHVMDIGAPDPGSVEFAGFLRPTLKDLSAQNPNIQQQLTDWQTARAQAGQDPLDYAAFRQNEIGIGAPDPGPVECIGFRG